MELVDIVLLILSGLCFFCAFFILPRLSRRRRKKLEIELAEKLRRMGENLKEDPGEYVTLGELPADYLDKALDRTVDRVVLRLLPEFSELRNTIWQVMIAFMGILLAILGPLKSAFGVMR